MIEFGREICAHYQAASHREWLVTNGIGGYAMGTLAGVNTRSYHGLLIAALRPPTERVLLLSHLDETAAYAGREYPLFANRWADGTVDPRGYIYIERFFLDGTTPVWHYAFADALLEKRIWMEPGANTTYVSYKMLRGSGGIDLNIKVIVNARNHHATTGAGQGLNFSIQSRAQGVQVATGPDPETHFSLDVDRGAFQSKGEWIRRYFLAREADRGLNPIDDNYYAGDIAIRLDMGETRTLVASVDDTGDWEPQTAYARMKAVEDALLPPHATRYPAWIRQLYLAAGQFIVKRSSPLDANGRSVIAGYPWFTDWGRDTMISLPGLALATGRHELARSILKTFGAFVDGGMLPNRFPDEPSAPLEYNTVDATLWYFEALRAYLHATQDLALIEELFPVLQHILQAHVDGTRFHIKVDPADGLLYAGEPGVQLTWMDAKVDGRVVTPRIGKAVEINALWYHALMVMAEFGKRLGMASAEIQERADRVKNAFTRFWYETGNYCYDVLDGPQGHDASLRPNQIFAVSLHFSPLDFVRQKLVVDVCSARLLTSFGLRSLDPYHPDYQGSYGGDQSRRDGAYHQGAVWAWLMGAFISAHYRVYRDREAVQTFFRPFARHLTDHGLGTISEIFEGDPPHTPRGCIAQAWSVAEILRAWTDIFADG